MSFYPKAALSLVCLAAILLGCKQNYRKAPLPDPIENIRVADNARRQEVQLVEQMALYRDHYYQQLMRMRDFYDKQGNHLKTIWAEEEINHFLAGPRRTYIAAAEIAGPNLQAANSIPDADMVYEEAQAMKKAAQGELAGLGELDQLTVRKDMVYKAIDQFNMVIQTYPTSDKIDDAAFQIGDLYSRYIKDYATSLKYFERVWQWDPQTPWPVATAMARIYDHNLHDKVRAIELYEKVIETEAAFPDNVEYARKRIDRLSSELRD